MPARREPGPVEAQIILNELERLSDQVRSLVLKQPELREPVRFAVWPDESDPHEYGPLYVEMSQSGVRLWWLGTEREDEPESEWSWMDLRYFADRERDLPELEKMRDDLVREVEMYRRIAYRYRNAARSMRKKYDEYVAALPPGMPQIAVE
jgi:hypothetical protein